MNDLTLMIRNILDMECEHIRKGFITKEFAGNAINAFINGLRCEGKDEGEVRANVLLDFWAKWSKIYIENVNIGDNNG